MNAKIKSGEHLLHVNNWDNLKRQMVINFADKNTYLSFRQRKNRLEVKTTVGRVDIVFTGAVPLVTFYQYEKDQLILSLSPSDV